MEKPWSVLHDKIIVRRAPEKTVTVANMEIPDVAREKQNRGTVIAIGSGRIVPGAIEPVPLTVAVGDEVLFNRFSGVALNEDDDPDLIVMREDEVLAYRSLT